MSRLNEKQIKMLTEEFHKRNIRDVKELPWTVYKQIFDANPHENFDSNADRLISDLRLERVY